MVKAHYTVRGRRAIPLSATIRIRMMDETERELLKAALQEVEREILSTPKLKPQLRPR